MNESTPAKPTGKWTARLAYTAAVILIVSLIVGQTGASAFGAMSGLMVAILLGTIAFFITLIGLIKTRNLGALNAAGWLAIAFGVLAVNQTISMVNGFGGPPIHDITTDTENPPEFVTVVNLRKPGENTTSYVDDGTANKQLEAYPDIETIVLEDDAETVFARAMTAAKEMGWEIVASEPAEGHIEAVATTPFVGFKDDVVIRVRAGDAGTIVDVRSKSRIGKGDAGVNAKRIRAYTAELTGSK